MDNRFAGQVVFSIGTGRCGTKFVHEVFRNEPRVASVHERNRDNEAFHKYCKWYNLPVDHSGFLRAKEIEIDDDLRKKDVSFEASAHMSLSVLELYNHFSAKFILLVREPHKVINSYIQKGWYSVPVIYENKQFAPGYQYGAKQIHRSMGRIMPMGKEFDEWRKLSRVGKLSWFWKVINNRILEQFAEIPKKNSMVVKLEDLDYNNYLKICDFVSIRSKIKERKFIRIVKKKPNRAANKIPELASWSKIEQKEFEAYVKPTAERLGYEYRYDKL